MTETTDTDMTTEALVAWLATQTWSEFATSLADFYERKGYLSEKQEASARKMYATMLAKAAAKAAASPAKNEMAEVGLYLLDGEVYRVRWNRTKTGRYAERLAGPKSWDYAKGMAYKLTEANKVTAEMASEYGAAKGHCVNCGLEIGYGEDQRAVMVGYGEHCAKNNGWPFPKKSEVETVSLFDAGAEAVNDDEGSDW